MLSDICFVVPWFQGSSEGMSPEKEGLCAMSGKSCCPVGESKQDADQRTEVVEGVVLPEGVIAELVICLICCFCLPVCCCSGLWKHCVMFANITTALCDSMCEVGGTARGPLLQLVYHILAWSCLLLWKYFAETYCFSCCGICGTVCC